MIWRKVAVPPVFIFLGLMSSKNTHSLPPARLHLAKLRKYFLDNVQLECITVRAFKSLESVQSFRTTHLPDDIKKELNKIHQEAKERDKLHEYDVLPLSLSYCCLPAC